MAARRDVRRGALLVVIGAALFSVNAGVSRVIQTAGVASTTLTTVRCTGTAVVLLTVVLMRGERLRLPRTRGEVARVIGFGITGVALVQWFYFVAIDRLPVGIALLLQFTAPVLVAVFVRVGYREPVRPRLWLGLAASLGGLALVAEVWSGLSLDGLGVLAGFAAAASLAAYFLIGERSVSTASPLVVITEAFIVATVFWNIVSPLPRLFDTDVTSPTTLVGSLGGLHLPVWVMLTWLVLLGTVVPFVAELTALQLITATEVGLIGMLEPIGATVVGWAWFRETLSPVQLVGMAAILAGIAIAQTARTAHRGPDVAPGV